MTADIGAKFLSLYGKPAAGIGTAPGRVNLIGEHIDYNGGTVLPTVLDKSIHVAIAPNGTGNHRIRSESYELESVRPADSLAQDHWSDAAVGAMAKAAELGWLEGGFDIYISSNIPAGAGVSSSAALMTAILRAAKLYAGAELSAISIALKARETENDYIGVPCGIMDQMAVGLASFGEVLALNTHSLDTEIISIPPDWRFITMHSGITRKLTDGRYEERFKECAHAAKALSLNQLCRADLADLTPLPAPLKARARHVVTEQMRTLAAIDAIKAGNAEKFGALMTQSHTSYSNDFAASTPEIDALTRSALALGALGSRLTGGGFGGCIVSLVLAHQAEDWTRDMLAQNPAAWLV